MRRILLFGNSGSGKSTLARWMAARDGLGHLDLDTVAWAFGAPPRRNTLAASKQAIDDFTDTHDGWVIEGCYGDLIELLLDQANELIYLNLSPELCTENSRNRPWEPHKYSSKAAQEHNLQMLLDWIADYPHRDDACSASAHLRLYVQFTGSKRMLTEKPVLD